MGYNKTMQILFYSNYLKTNARTILNCTIPIKTGYIKTKSHWLKAHNHKELTIKQ